MRSVAGSLVALLVMTATIQAEESKKDDVQSLYYQCKKSETNMGFGYCIGYISGIGSQMMWTSHTIEHITDFNQRLEVGFVSACAKSFVSNGAMVQAFINWAEKHPEEWVTDKQLGVIQAIRGTWPCDLTAEHPKQ